MRYRSKDVSLQRLRPFIAQCRERFGLRYPLAHLRPFTDGRRLLLEAQTEAGSTGELRVIYELASGQLELHWGPSRSSNGWIVAATPRPTSHSP